MPDAGVDDGMVAHVGRVLCRVWDPIVWARAGRTTTTTPTCRVLSPSR